MFLLFWLVGCPGAGVVVPPGGNDNISNGNNGEPVAELPDVRLDVSNPTPLPNEQVELTCSVVNEALGPFAFEFSPEFGRLIVSIATGRATFIVDAVDVGIAIPFTCTATNASGSSEPSNSVLVTPTR